MTIRTPGTPTKLFVLFPLLLLCACRANSPRSAATPGRAGEPLELERLMVGSVFGVGSGFESDGLKFRVDALGEGSGNAQVVGAAATSKGAGPKSLRLAHASLHVAGLKTSALEFDFQDNGARVALEIGGESRAVADFIELNGSTIGGVAVAVTESNTAGERWGHVSLSGPIRELAISGSDLVLADLRRAK